MDVTLKRGMPMILSLRLVKKGALPVVLLSALAFQWALHAQSYLGWSDLKPGPYAVGFKAAGARDETRTFGHRRGYDGTVFEGDLGRPVEVLVWYPAVKTPGSDHMNFGDYVTYGALELAFREPTPDIRKAAIDGFTGYVTGLGASRKDVDRLLGEKTTAVLNAPPADGPFPVVIYAPSFGSAAFENSVLCEFLASHGYIVAASPSMGAQTREMTQDASGLQAQVRDVEFLIGYMREFPHADIDRLGLAGFSWGGLSDVVATLDDARVGAVISLDGSIRSKRGLEIARYSPSFKPDNLRVPFLLMLSGRPAEAATERDLSFYDALKYSDACLLTLGPLEHRNFCSQFTLVAGMVPGTAKDTNTGDVMLGYEAVCDYSLNFFDAHLKGREASLTYLRKSPEDNGFSAKIAAVTCRKALKAPPTEGQFLNIVLEDGAARGREIWKQVEGDNPGYVLFGETSLNRIGYYLLQHNRVPEAVRVFELNKEAYPSSANTYDSLGEAYLRAGNLAAAEMVCRNALDHLGKDTGLDAGDGAMMRRHIEGMLEEIARKKR